MNNAISLERLDAGYGAKQILFNIDLEFQDDAVTGIFGPNGAGKTTLLRTILKILSFTKGRISVFGNDVSDLRTDQITARGISMVPQDRGLFPDLTVIENLLLGGHQIKTRRDVARSIDEIFDYFPILSSRRRQHASLLSGGEQQMLAIGKALMAQPRILILDEPSFGLAPIAVQNILQIATNWRIRQRASLIIVEQNAKLVLPYCTDAVVINSGIVVYAGSANKFVHSDDIIDLYLGS